MSTQKTQLAGMALRNGVMIFGPTQIAVSIRTKDGSIKTTVRPSAQTEGALISRVPLLRGPIMMSNMFLSVSRLMRAEPRARLLHQSTTTMLILLSSKFITRKLQQNAASPTAKELLGAGTSLIATLLSLRVGELSAYHGAEHKVVGGYELGVEAAAASRVHPRCGTQLALPMMIGSFLATQIALRVSPRHTSAARMTGQLVGLAGAVELVRTAQQGKAGLLGRATMWTGRLLQRYVTTREPTPAQLEVAISARDSLLQTKQR